jgi:hypothetical protein
MAKRPTHSSKALVFLRRAPAALQLFGGVLDDEAGRAFVALVDALGTAADVASLRAYGRWFVALAEVGVSWRTHLIRRILLDENPFSRRAQSQPLEALDVALVAAARRDLGLLGRIAASGPRLAGWLAAVAPDLTAPVAWPEPKSDDLFADLDDWGAGITPLASHYRRAGIGVVAAFAALRWQGGRLIGVERPDGVHLDDLVGYEAQRALLLKNTEFLLAGYLALNVLLYGSRGSGKSSLVKALSTAYAGRGLRLLEVRRSELAELPAIVELVRSSPLKFVVFVDDLSFEADDDQIKALKVVLEGGLTARPANVVVYATSNRRHLVRESFADRSGPTIGDEVHAFDTVHEKLAFSDRFGLTLTFDPTDQPTYLRIVTHLAERTGITLPPADLERRALQWALRHKGRSGRTARQFIDFLRAELGG